MIFMCSVYHQFHDKDHISYWLTVMWQEEQLCLILYGATEQKTP
jgi:hypothetical protein